MNASSNVPNSPPASTGAGTGEASVVRAPFVPPVVSELGRLTELTLLGGSL